MAIVHFRRIISLNRIVEQRLFHTSSKLNEFHEYDRKSGYPTGRKFDRPPPDQKNLSFVQKIKQGYYHFKEELGLFVNEWKQFLLLDHIVEFRRGEVDVKWRFNGNESSLYDWVITCDSDWNEGYSSVNLELSPTGTGIFSGVINTTVVKTGIEDKYSGYCNMRTIPKYISFKRQRNHDWIPYTHLVMKVRGDGRGYLLNLSCVGYFDIMWNDIWSYALYTRGGPYWQLVKIPFSKFFLSSKGTVQDHQRIVERDDITYLGITVMRPEGPFRLEIDWIGCEYDPIEKEEFAYESYNIKGVMF